MGLASFNRMRRERAPVNRAETERFIEDNAARQGRPLDRQRQHARNKARVPEIREEELAAGERIGAKNEIAAQSSDPTQDPLRADAAAVREGANVAGAQHNRSPLARLEERIPTEEGSTAAEALAPHLGAESDGPTAEQVEAARRAQEDELELPENWRSLHADEMKDLAVHLGMDDPKTGKEAREFIESKVGGE